MRILKKIAIFLSLLFAFVVLSIGLFSYFYGDEIKRIIVENINKGLKTKIEVKAVDFTVWNSFPRASIRFSDVIVFEVDSESDTLLSAKKLSVEFNLIELYRKNYRLIGLNIADGQCALKVFHSGENNYVFWETSDSSSTSSFSTELENVLIENMRFSYKDQTKNIAINFLIDQADLKGDFSQSLFNLNIHTTLKSSSIQYGEETIIKDRTLFIFANGTVNQDEESIEFQDANLGIDGMNLSLKGNYYFSEKSRIDFQIQSNNADLEKAVALLPIDVKNALERFKISGKAAFNGFISGEISAISKPSYQFNFSIEEGIFKDTKSAVNFEKCFLNGSVKNGITNDLAGSVLELTNFSTSIREGTISGKLLLENFENPSYSFDGKLNIDLSAANEFFKWENIDQANGKVNASLSMGGKLADFGKYSLNDWKRSNIKGEVNLSNINLIEIDNQLHFNAINGNLTFTNNSIATSDLKGKVNDNFLEMNGKLINLIGFFAQEDEVLIIDAALNSPNFDLGNFSSTSETDDDKIADYSLPSRLKFYLDLDFDAFIYREFLLKNLSSRLIVSNKQIDLRDIDFQSEDGDLKGDFFVRESADRLQISALVDLKKANIHTLFSKFNNFGQNTLKAEHISGQVTANIQFYSEWSKQLEVDLKSIKVESNLIIDQGVLKNFQPLESLSKYIELEELKTVKFRTLSNQILISDETVYIPRFDVLSSAINLSMEGKHGFNNQVDYKFTIGLNQLLGKKVKKTKESEFGYEEDEKTGGVKLFLRMTGSAEDPTIKYDSKELKKSINQEFTKEKNTTKSLLKEEFGWFKKDTSIKTLPEEKRKLNPFQVEYDSSFIKNDSKSTKNFEKSKDKNETKSKFGKFLDKIAQPNEEEYTEPIEK
tara:strand:- start:31338 stop:33992 length:2655 start_codon:yes stop_codon:yes gene_type:complete